MVPWPARERARHCILMTHAKKLLTILLASPRGFCAGVERAIQIVERALERYGRPVYVRHEIVHNRFVVESLEAKGAIFVEELDSVPDDRPVVFSAHGVPKAVPAEAARRALGRYGRPVYARHEIVHTGFGVEGREARGAIFVGELDWVPDDRPVVFPAHGVPKAGPAGAARRHMLYLDAPCPLVSKVHR